ncbi:hypothetical protein AWU68_1074 [Corynebacterium simulans]|uniref:Uncharacterized protein n=1 Tax=Corynebacterium simulans TaxID=146827 RepID=A0ABR5VEF1_9CORY|nr:hypothetical protein WM42_0955 [Corynebacterium simulans]AMO91366.1 hypothetical protein AWU68_1074 [Corynebacterium simulans]KXU18856.1 hypothetical protein WM41_0389 [Corynebacterium simulans]
MKQSQAIEAGDFDLSWVRVGGHAAGPRLHTVDFEEVRFGPVRDDSFGPFIVMVIMRVPFVARK